MCLSINSQHGVQRSRYTMMQEPYKHVSLFGHMNAFYMPGKYDVRPDVTVVLSEIKKYCFIFQLQINTEFYLVLQQRDAGFLTLFSSCI